MKILLIIAGVLLVASLFVKPTAAAGYETFVDAPAVLPDFMKDALLSVPISEEEKVKLLAFYEAYTAAAYKDTAIEMSKKTGDQVQIFTDILGGTYGVTPTIFLRMLPDVNSAVSGYFGKPWKEAYASDNFKNAVKRNLEWYMMNPTLMPISRVRRPVSEENKFLQNYNSVMARYKGAEMNENIPTPGATATPAAAAAVGATPATPSATPVVTAATPAATPAPAPAAAATPVVATPATPATPALSENATPAEKLRQLKSLLKCANMTDVAEPEVTYKLVSNFLKCQAA